MRKASTSKRPQPAEGKAVPAWLSGVLWGVAFILVAFAVLLMLNDNPFLNAGASKVDTGAPVESPVSATLPFSSEITVPLPDLAFDGNQQAITRLADAHTIIPNRMRSKATEYTVEKGDSIFYIAKLYDLKPETILWANYDLLDDNPNMVSVGQTLRIPATDGVYYQWKEGDTLEKIAGQYLVDTQDIITWPGNNLDLTDPEVEPGTFVMVPGGWRENRQWVVPTYWRPNAGATQTINGPGGCAVGPGGYVGSGFFGWPTVNHYLSGNDYWSGHLGIDIAGPTGAPVYAADSGVVVYAGVIGGGYGNMIMIDHGNGFHTLYAHLNAIFVSCGESVLKGGQIGQVGSTGNSTGPHLHFEIRYMGSFVNPWDYM